MNRKTSSNPKSPSKKIGNSNKCVTVSTPFLGKPQVTVTVLDYGTDIMSNFPFTKEQILHEHEVFIPKDATFEQIEEIIKRYVKVVLPDYTGEYITLCNPVDVSKVTAHMLELAKTGELNSFDSNAGSILRMIGHIYVLLLDPYCGGKARGNRGGPKKGAGAKEESPTRLGPPGANKPPDDCVEPSAKRRRIASPSEIDLGSMHLRDDEWQQQSTDNNRGSHHGIGNSHAPSVVDTTNSRKRKLGHAPHNESSRPMDLSETCAYILSMLSRRRAVGKRVVSKSMPRLRLTRD